MEQQRLQWTQYEKDYKSTIESLHKFSKSLSVPVMVPIIENLAYMSGHLVHTNQVLMSLGDNCTLILTMTRVC